MKPHIIFILIMAAALATCKNDKTAESPEDYLLQEVKEPAAVEVRIEGVVKCTACQPSDQMMITVYDDSGSPLTIWGPSSMGNGEFMMDVYAVPADKLKLVVDAGVHPTKSVERVVQVPEGDHPVISDVTISLE